MSPLVLLLATPIFGLQLHVDLGLAPSVVSLAPQASYFALEAGEPEASAEAQMEKRARVARVHRALGIATWSSMTVTVVLGTLQYANLYGFFAPAADTRCVEGDAFFGQAACTRIPWPHLASALATTALYTTTFVLSFAMPDPIGLDQGESRSARRLRQHKRLRWVHVAGMAAQLALGFVISNSEGLGLDRANDYRTLQALSTVHLLVGLTTYATLTWSGALMVF